jgi:deazaflavin-dependent oxidoreductase (nitroreductase family)
MLEKISEPKPPSGLMRVFARAPIGFYRVGLGWVFGGRFLMLTHIGRVTGKQRNVVLEVVRNDAPDDAFYVASGWGERSDWLLNIQKEPNVNVHFKRRSFPAVAERLSVEDAELEILDYGRRYPAAFETARPPYGVSHRIHRSCVSGAWATHSGYPLAGSLCGISY